jgi:hypothetical protein
MKTVDYLTFCDLPNGTIYREVEVNKDGGHGLPGELSVRFDVLRDDDGWPRDFVEGRMIVESGDNRAHYGCGRWGLFEYDNLYIVYDELDIRHTVRFLTDPMEFFNLYDHKQQRIPEDKDR